MNVMSSVLAADGKRGSYKELDPKLTQEIARADTTILLVIDGMGADSVSKLGRNSFLKKHHTRNLTTIFPSATTAAITSFLTGMAPQQHGFPGWYTFLKEVKMTSVILRSLTRYGKNLDTAKISYPAPIFNHLSAPSYIVIGSHISKSPYNGRMKGKAKILTYASLSGLFRRLGGLVRRGRKRRFVYAYWDGFDSLSHHYGKTSSRARGHLRQIDEQLRRFAGRQGTSRKNVLLLVTSDHGQIVCSKKKTILLNKHPHLLQCLASRPAGEFRAVFCRVLPSRRKVFERYVLRVLQKYCSLHRSEEFLKKGLFGRGKIHPHFKDRIGNYILLAKGNYAFRDFLPWEKPVYYKGHHGGLSKEEMTVPLVLWKNSKKSKKR